MKIKVIDAQDLTARHLAAWEEIRGSSTHLRSPYFSPWFTRLVACARKDVRVAILGDEQDPTAFFPFQVGRWRLGRPVGGPFSDYHGPIAAPEAAIDAHALITACGLAAWDFDHLPAANKSFAACAKVRSFSPYMDLTRGYEDYCEQVRASGSKQIVKVGTLRRKLERELGEPRFVMDVAGDDGLLERLMAIKSAQYRESQIVDAFAYPWTRSLLRLINGVREGDFAGVLSALYLGDDPIAIHFGMRSRDVLHYWFPVYSAEHSRFSPGLILLLKMAEHANASGIRHIELGKGESLYKQRLMSGQTDLLEGTVETPSLLAGFRKAFAVWERCMANVPIRGLRDLPSRVRGRMVRKRRYR